MGLVSLNLDLQSLTNRFLTVGFSEFDAVLAFEAGQEFAGDWPSFSSPLDSALINVPIKYPNPRDACNSFVDKERYQGTIVAVSMTGCRITSKIHNAVDAGVAAIVFYNSKNNDIVPVVDADHQGLLPIAILNPDVGAAFNQYMAKNLQPETTVSMSNLTRKTQSESQFVYNQWMFMSVRHWGEFAYGRWQLLVEDKFSSVTGTLKSFSIIIHAAELKETPPGS
jgi:hypothetical protein